MAKTASTALGMSSSSQLSFLRLSAQPKLPRLPIEATFTHTTVSPESQVALQYWPRRDGSSSSPSQLTLFILGNPGLLDYYIPFLNHLQSLLPPSHAILSTSHLGHTPGLVNPPKPLDLPSQLEAKVELVTNVRLYLDTWAKETECPTPKLSLMGHSVGSWFMCELMKRLPQDVSAGYMLFPTVGWIANSWNGWKLWPIFTRPVKPLLPMLTPLLGPILPYTAFPPTTLSLLRSPETIDACLTLGQSEMANILEPDWNWFRTQAAGAAEETDTTIGLSGIWAKGGYDGWVGKEGPLIQDCLGGLEKGRVKVLDKVPHAFCLTQANSELVAETLAQLIDPSITIPVPHKPAGHVTAAETVVPM